MACSRGAPFLARLGKTVSLFRINTQNTHSFGITRHPPIMPYSVSSIEKLVSVRPQALHSLTHTNFAAPLVQMTRGFHNTSSLRDNDKPATKPKFGEQMTLRLINENGFLSWTRNSYLSAAVGATMLNGATGDVMHHPGMLVLVVSAMNMVWGSACHFSNLIRVRDRCAMSRPTLFLNLLGCVVHALLWLLILGYYIRLTGHHNCQHQEMADSMPRKEQ